MITALARQLIVEPLQHDCSINKELVFLDYSYTLTVSNVCFELLRCQATSAQCVRLNSLKLFTMSGQIMTMRW